MQRQRARGVVNVAYLLNTYPMTSTTFIRREIDALVASGVHVSRFAARRWDQQLVEPLDIAEQQRTHYLLAGNVAGLLAAFLRELVVNPVRLGRAFAIAFTLYRNARGGFARHCAYLLQAAYFKQHATDAAIDHVHAHFATNATAIALLAHALGGPGYSFTAHGPDEFDNTDRLSYPLKVGRARFVAAISDFCRVQLVRASGWEHWERIAVIRCGVPITPFEPAADFGAANQVFVTVARVDVQKGLMLLPEALALLKAEFPALKIVLIGDGLERQRLETAIIDHGVDSMIERRGWQSNPEVARAIRASRGLLLPSFAEGLPVVIMEAFAAGRPVIATSIAGIPELVDATCGWLVPAGSASALADAMRLSLTASADDLRAKGLEGRRRCTALHDVVSSAAQLEARFASFARETAA